MRSILSGLFGWLAERTKKRSEMQWRASKASANRAHFYAELSAFFDGKTSLNNALAYAPWHEWKLSWRDFWR
jgi:hypothetical protein